MELLSVSFNKEALAMLRDARIAGAIPAKCEDGVYYYDKVDFVNWAWRIGRRIPADIIAHIASVKNKGGKSA